MNSRTRKPDDTFSDGASEVFKAAIGSTVWFMCLGVFFVVVGFAASSWTIATIGVVVFVPAFWQQRAMLSASRIENM